jgi:hypothetical protein
MSGYSGRNTVDNLTAIRDDQSLITSDFPNYDTIAVRLKDYNTNRTADLLYRAGRTQQIADLTSAIEFKLDTDFDNLAFGEKIPDERVSDNIARTASVTTLLAAKMSSNLTNIDGGVVLPEIHHHGNIARTAAVLLLIEAEQERTDSEIISASNDLDLAKLNLNFDNIGDDKIPDANISNNIARKSVTDALSQSFTDFAVANITDNNTLVRTTGDQTIGGVKTFTSNLKVEASNFSTVISDGEITLTTDGTVNSTFQMITDTFNTIFTNNQADTRLEIDQNVSIPTGKTYQINGTPLASTDLSNGASLAMLPTIYTRDSNTITIKDAIDTTNNTTMLLSATDTFTETGTGTVATLAYGDNGFYRVRIRMKHPDVSTQEGIYLFAATFDLPLHSNTNDGDAIPEIELPLSQFHRVSNHGAAKLIFIPKSSNAWELHLIWDTVNNSGDYDNDQFQCDVVAKTEYWG